MYLLFFLVKPCMRTFVIMTHAPCRGGHASVSSPKSLLRTPPPPHLPTRYFICMEETLLPSTKWGDGFQPSKRPFLRLWSDQLVALIEKNIQSQYFSQPTPCLLRPRQSWQPQGQSGGQAPVCRMVEQTKITRITHTIK